MNAIAKEASSTTELGQLKSRLKSIWMTGDYDLFSRYMEKDAEIFFQHLGIEPGTRLLDVGCGAGQLALIAARAGAEVTGCDISTNWLEKARDRAASEGLNITFEEGDAESLPYENGQFDAVVSLFGAMFAPRPELVAAELTRVCKPGGIIAMANWTPGGFIGQMFKTISKHIAPSGMPAPVLWGDEDTVRDRLSDGIAKITFERRMYRFDYPFSPEAVVDFYRVNYGPMSQAFASLDDRGQTELRNELIALWSKHNLDGENATKVDAEYLEIVATRQSNDAQNVRSISRRAEALAERIEEGGAKLGAFAEELSEAEWNSVVSETDKRTVGVIVHHVASMYPIEIEVARVVASGKEVSDVTGDVVAQINAKHAEENAGASKSATLELLRRNSHEAANAVRSLTNDELDQAAPFSLSFGAPVTTQFVIEDHALRHSWHHLARIRKALGR